MMRCQIVTAVRTSNKPVQRGWSNETRQVEMPDKRTLCADYRNEMCIACFFTKIFRYVLAICRDFTYLTPTGSELDS
jgi:hypothetical protein